MKDIVINTGAQRNVLGHVISGAIASAVISGAINYKKVKANEVEKKLQLKILLKRLHKEQLQLVLLLLLLII